MYTIPNGQALNDSDVFALETMIEISRMARGAGWEVHGLDHHGILLSRLIDGHVSAQIKVRRKLDSGGVLSDDYEVWVLGGTQLKGSTSVADQVRLAVAEFSAR